ncbi:hypothetical protein [Nocardioides nanhaiensis]|uniref:Uncharacterized protein n=1 Tax=Nocardioides nanhaiensis TaxID=1476871 RepID=A0ABP8WFL3_9ACTN
MIAQLRRHAVASLYLDLFLDRVWRPFLEDGHRAQQWAEVEDALRDVRRLATETLVGAFEQVMSSRVTEVLDQQVVRPAASGRGSAKPQRSREPG